jgi:hypothetical protein
MKQVLKNSLLIVREVFRKPFGNTTITRSNDSREKRVFAAEKVKPENDPQDQANSLNKVVESLNEKSRQPELKDPKITISPVFKLVFITASSFTLVSFVVLILMTILIKGDFSDQQNKLAAMLTTTFQTGFGAIIGLIGGKAI